MAKKPTGPVPRKTPLYSEDSDDLSYNWVSFFNVLRDNTYDIRDFTVEVDPPALSSNSSTEVSVTAPEVEADDAVMVASAPSISPGYIIGGSRAGDGELFISFSNVSTGSIDPGTETYTFVILKR